MDGRNNGSSLFCQFVQKFYEVEGSCGIEAGCGFIQKYYGGVDEQLQSN